MITSQQLELITATISDDLKEPRMAQGALYCWLSSKQHNLKPSLPAMLTSLIFAYVGASISASKVLDYECECNMKADAQTIKALMEKLGFYI